MRSFVRLAVLAAGGLLAAACAGRAIYNNMLSGGYRPYVFGYAAGRRDLTTIIVGNPFEIEQAELDRRLVDMLNESELPAADPLHHHPRPERARQQYRAVFLLNRQIVLPGQACQAPNRSRRRSRDNHAPDRRVLPARRLSQHRDRRAPGRDRHRRSAPAPTDRADGAFVPAGRSDPRRQQHALPDRWLSGVRIAVQSSTSVRRRRITLPWTCARNGSVGPPERTGRGAKRPESRHAVVHHDRAGDREIDAKACRDAHGVIAAGDHCRRQRAALGAEHIGGIQRVAEARQQGRLVEQLHADQGAALRQRDSSTASKRHSGSCCSACEVSDVTSPIV